MEKGIGGTDALDWDIFLLVRTWAPANVKVRGGGGKDQLLVWQPKYDPGCWDQIQGFSFLPILQKESIIIHEFLILTKIKRATIFFQVGEGLLTIFLACSNFWRRKTSHFCIQIFKLCWTQKNAQNYYFESFGIISRWSSITEAATLLTAFLLLILPSGQKSRCYLLFTFYLNYFWLPYHL